MKEQDDGWFWYYWLLAIGLTLMVFGFSGCSSTRYVPVESVQHDSIYITKLQVDSVIMRDSISIETKGDTIFVNKNYYHYKYKLLRDTMYIERVDSIQVPFPIEKQLSKWEKVKQEIGGIAIGGFVVLLLVIIVWLIKKKFS